MTLMQWPFGPMDQWLVTWRARSRGFRDVLERIEGHGKVHCRADVYVGWNRSRTDVGDYSITPYVAGADRQAELISVEFEGKTRAEIAIRRPALQPGSGHGPGFLPRTAHLRKVL